MLNKLSGSIKRNGLGKTLFYCCRLLFDMSGIPYLYKYVPYRFSADYVIHQRRVENSRKLSNKLCGVVRYGPFKGMILGEYVWGQADFASMLLGIYEKEVLENLSLASKKYDIFVDLGAADGYFAVGCLRNKMFKKTYCYEISPVSRARIKDHAVINNVIDNIQIYGRASHMFYLKLVRDGIDLSRCVILCDIEGGEFDLFDENVLKALRRSIVIIEIHDWHKNGETKLKILKESASRYFNLVEIKTGARDLSDFPEIANLKDDDRWLLCSEGRHYLQTWLELVPKISKN